VASVAVGGVRPWTDYLTVVRAASAADVVLVANVGPAAQIARLTGGSEDLARLLQLVVLAIAVVGTAYAAWTRDDPVESFAWAAVASLVVLPVTWIHYPVVLVPVALAAWFRSDPAVHRAMAGLLVGALVIAVVAVGFPVLVWVAVALTLFAVHRAVPARSIGVPLPTVESSRLARAPTHGAQR
jgi:hypothetical protein